ncbi:MAG: transporter substrate-binding domain-containing protein [Gammaproteobacteria bacterium]|uniref:Bacterial extracellular solute-binding protein, family 3 n=1 Tax=Marinobacter litoralis TaxID=187981 RepID=A0A3M2RCS7_9GAMM|nr:transporter substrate-binding domain-containing protein [Marinobacter litoralis]MBR9872467.1 transporter substrate-binding domain-containing protein [Gammaproteobacteria bacterium]RMJ02929.1 Bacterial extracellular solute-binding protein, family 3 [Marinobacter litoralis]
MRLNLLIPRAWRRFIYVLISGLCLLGVVGTVHAENIQHTDSDTRTLRVAYMEFPPVTYQNAFGEPEGAMVGTTRKVAKEAGYELEFLYLPVSRAYLYLKKGGIDFALGLTEVPALEGAVIDSDISLVSVVLSAWYRDDQAPIKDISGFRNQVVILINGFTYGGLRSWLERQDDIRITNAPNHRSAIDMLQRGRGDYLLDYRDPVREELKGFTDAMIQETEIRTRTGAWLFSAAIPDAQILKAEFDAAYHRLAERGELPPADTGAKAILLQGFPTP